MEPPDGGRDHFPRPRPAPRSLCSATCRRAYHSPVSGDAEDEHAVCGGTKDWPNKDTAAIPPATAAAPEVSVTGKRGHFGKPAVLAVPKASTQSPTAPAASDRRKRSGFEVASRAPTPRTISLAASDRDKVFPAAVRPGAPTHSLANEGASNAVTPTKVRIIASRSPTRRARSSLIGPATKCTYPLALGLSPSRPLIRRAHPTGPSARRCG